MLLFFRGKKKLYSAQNSPKSPSYDHLARDQLIKCKISDTFHEWRGSNTGRCSSGFLCHVAMRWMSTLLPTWGDPGQGGAGRGVGERRWDEEEEEWGASNAGTTSLKKKKRGGGARKNAASELQRCHGCALSQPGSWKRWEGGGKGGVGWGAVGAGALSCGRSIFNAGERVWVCVTPRGIIH